MINKVNQPLFFKISYQGRTDFILGTNHIFSSEVLTDACLDLIEECTMFVGEGKDAEVEERLDFRENFLKYCGRKETDVDWFALLSLDQKKQVTEMFTQSIQYEFGDYAPDVFVGDVKLSNVSNIIEMNYNREHIRGYIKERLPDLFEPGCMDFELEDLFERTSGLEGYFDLYKQENFINAEMQDLQDLMDMIKMNNNEMDDCIEELSQIWHRYRDGTNLYDHDYVEQLVEDEDEQDNWILKIQNQVFFQSMIDHMSTPGPILFAVGAAHLLGENGLLIKFEDAGIDVSLYDPNDCEERFKPFKYGYRDYLQSKHTISIENKPGLYFNYSESGLEVETIGNDALLEPAKNLISGKKEDTLNFTSRVTL